MMKVMIRDLRLRTPSLVIALSLACFARAQSYFSSDAMFCSPDYFTPGATTFTGADGSQGKVSIQDLHVTTARFDLPLDGLVHQYDFGFDCSTDWDFGSANSGQGSGKMSMSLQFDGIQKDGSYLFTGKLNTLACVSRRKDNRASMAIRNAATMDSFVCFQFQSAPSSGTTGIHPNGQSGGYVVENFFDVFFDVSLDGGATFTTSDNAAHLQGTPEPASIAAMALGLTALLRKRRNR